MTDETVTKDGIRVEIGQVWRDLDKRMRGRQCKIVAIDPYIGKVRMINVAMKGRGTWVSVKRMHKHATGWELVKS